jgi:hypothetical protein
MVATPVLMFAFLAVDGRFHIPLLLLLGLSALSVGPVIMALSLVLRSRVIVAIKVIGDLLACARPSL